MSSEDDRHDRETVEWNRIQNNRTDAIDQATRIELEIEATHRHVRINDLNNKIASHRTTKPSGGPANTPPPVLSLNELGKKKDEALDELKLALSDAKEKLGECTDVFDRWLEDWAEQLDLICQGIHRDASAARERVGNLESQVRTDRAERPLYGVQSGHKDRHIDTQLEFLGNALIVLGSKCLHYVTHREAFDNKFASLHPKPQQSNSPLQSLFPRPDWQPPPFGPSRRFLGRS